ncbi:MAG: LysM peptidoglycan-binding domain-containing protein, partial [Chloroflexota bacterium]
MDDSQEDNVMRRTLATIAVAAVMLLTGILTAFAQQNVVYTVQGGDTLAAIAARFGTTQQAIINANGLTNPNTLFAGTLLTIPVPAAPPAQPAQPTSQFGTGGPVIVAPNNPAVSPTSTPVPVVVVAATPQFGTGGPVAGAPAGQTYTVRTGEGLFEIAVRFGTTAEAIAELNGITNINAIQAGQVLRLPAGSTAQVGTGGPVTNAAVRPFQYTVQPGEYVELLALRFGTTIEAISTANDLSNPGLV